MFPLVFMLHGSAGIVTAKTDSEPSFDNFGENELAHDCFAVALPHYLEAIGHKSIISRQEIDANFPQMLAAVELLLSRAETLPWVQGRPVFVFGDSLGGYLAIALAFQRSEVLAVSEISGGKPEGYAMTRHQAPRVLISHGGSDTLVPPSEAEALRQYCMANEIPVNATIYPGEGHYLSQDVRQQILSRTVDFFRKNAQPEAN
jgi:dienelactone hydrolase